MMTVRQKQWQLKYLDFYKGNIDGIWGAASRSATIAFQREFGIKDDGIFGFNTEEKSLEVIDAIQDVLVVRTNIALVNDGLAGPSTMNATTAFQKLVGIQASGLANKATRDAVAKNAGPNSSVSSGSNSVEKSDESEAANDWWDDIEFFDRDEFKCKCGGKYCNGYPSEMKKEVVQIADLARKHFGAPAHVVSGLRCKTHNANEGGVPNSQHMYGEAIDLRVDGASADQLLAFVKSQKKYTVRYAYKINSTNVHFDIPKGAR